MMKISVGRLTTTALTGVVLTVALISGCGNQSNEGTQQVTTAPTLSPEVLATSAPVLDNKRWRPGTGVRYPSATKAAKE